MLKNLYTRLTGDPNEKEIKRITPIVAQIGAHEAKLQNLSDAELRAKTDAFKVRLQDTLAAARAQVADRRERFDTASADDRRGCEEELRQAEKELVAAERAALDAILPEAFACVREASVRTIGLRHFDVQLIGGVVLHEGKVAEMRTGEGKTLVATAPLYLNALLGHGAHLVTVNDYLARRDAQWMGAIYHLLGLSVGILQQGEKSALIFDLSYKAATEELDFLRPCPRRDAYAADITYGTNNEFGFDYLRDNMAWRLEERVQRERYFAIVDEVDNILIDEARTPLIISAPAGEAADEYYVLADLVRKLAPDDYTIEQRTRAITLTEAGYDRVEQLLGVPLYDPDHPEELDPRQAKLMHHLEAALKAQYLFLRDKDYIVRKGQVIIVDEFTGRLMPGRRWSDGLHQAVEAKERVPIQQESVTYATVTLQNYFRLYKHLAGMTGTAKTEEDEFFKVYGLSVVAIPTNKKMAREDQPDQIYRNEEAKWRAVAVELVRLYARGQPTLIGTTSVEASERLSKRIAAPKLQLYARARLLHAAVENHSDLSDKQRAVLKTILARRLEDASEIFEENFSARLFHAYDLSAVTNAVRQVPLRDLAGAKKRLARGGKDAAGAQQQWKLSDKAMAELDALNERAIRFAVWLDDHQLRLDAAQTLCDEIAARPDDLAKLAPRFNLPVETVLEVYQKLRLTREELGEINRALIDSLGDQAEVGEEYCVRDEDLARILKDLFLREEDVARLAKQIEGNFDPLAPNNVDALREPFGVSDAAQLAEILRGGIKHAVLNAKEHDREAKIIARAGELRAMTLATSMAGRGVDIKLGGELREHTLSEVNRVLRREGIDPYNLALDEKLAALEKIPTAKYHLYAEHLERFKKYMYDRATVHELGGLRIIGTERQEARRIDNQLRGRSGRQGDAGSSRFYVSLEDEIMRRMGGKGLMDRVWVEDIPLEHDWVTKAIEQAQVKMESYNFDIRKHLLDYDDVLNKQREIIYGQRNRILTKADLRGDLRGWLEEEIARILVEDLKAREYAAARLLSHLDSLMPGIYTSATEFWSPFSLTLVQRALGELGDAAQAREKILAAAQNAMELHRDFIAQAVVPEAVQVFEQQYRATWDEIEDLAKNTLNTLKEEAQEQQRAFDARTVIQTVGQAVRLQIDVRAERGTEITEKLILEATRRAFDLRIVAQVVYRVSRRAGLTVEFQWTPDGALNFDALRAALATAITDAYTAQANKHLAEIERELGELVKTPEDARGLRLAHVLLSISRVWRTTFDQRTHRRVQISTPRFPWDYFAATQADVDDQEKLRAEILEYWTQSLEQLEALRGGVDKFNDLIRELMLSIVTNLWIDYLTDIESLREGIGLQAFAQRDPLVEYKRRAFDMFQDLYARIRSQVVTYVFTYQYRGLAKLESESRDRAARQAIAAPSEEGAVTPALAAGGDAPKLESKKQKAEPKSKPEPARKPVGAVTSAKLGRNDPCWCGSGKKYKNCHMQSDLR